jgi:hypothetical protein
VPLARSLVCLAVLGLTLAGCGSKSSVPTLSGVQHCLDDDPHFAQFVDGASADAAFALGELPAEIRRESLVVLVSQVGAGSTGGASDQGVVLAVLREETYAVARRWGDYLGRHTIRGNRGSLKPAKGEAYAWVVGRVTPGTAHGSRAAWVRRWGRTQQYAYRALLACFGHELPPGVPPLPKP